MLTCPISLICFEIYGEKLKDFVRDQVPILRQAKENKDNILVEGANAAMLDLDSGTFPFVTSSNTGLGGVFTGLTLDWRMLKEVIGVVKAYTTRVGSGPFPTLNGASLGTFPANLDTLDNVEVTYMTMPGWKSPTTKLTKWDDLPGNARKYIEFIEEFVGIPIRYIGTGPGRDDMIGR